MLEAAEAERLVVEPQEVVVLVEAAQQERLAATIPAQRELLTRAVAVAAQVILLLRLLVAQAAPAS